MKASRPLAVDLFCGAGGLSRGLQAAGYRVAAGVELHPASAATYALNNPGTVTVNADIRAVAASHLADILPGKVALLAACPPCQGFTSLTSKLRRDDPRNDLAFEIIRFARALRPETIMFENVPRFATSSIGRRRFDELVHELENLGYRVSWEILQAADFGTAQLRRRLVVWASKTLISPPTATHSQHPRPHKKPWRTVADVIGDQGDAEVYDRSRDRSGRPIREWHVVRKLNAANISRLAAARPGAPRWELPDYLRPDCHKGSSSGFANVYGRMRWDTPSPTITGGCTSPSKGRFGHPASTRTISVLEAALLQDFPSGHLIASKSIDETCAMIGNAFPARLAQAAAKQVLKSL